MINRELYRLLESSGYPVYAFATTEAADCIVYQYILLTSDGIKEQGRLETTIIAGTLEKGQTMLQKVKDTLLTIGDEKRTETILEIALNGGGVLENPDTGTVHLKAIFSVKNRYRRGLSNE